MLGLVAAAVCAASLLGALKIMPPSKMTPRQDKLVTLLALHAAVIFIQAFHTF
jgi:hypothetical protein